jgi:Ca2+-binding RTX toxin-like protein
MTIINGNNSANTLNGTYSSDYMNGYGTDDRMFGNGGKDNMYGGDGNDYMDGGVNNDTVRGENGDDTLIGADGNDWLSDGAGTDRIEGGNGNDQLLGDDGNDNLFGDDGNDRYTGGRGNDFYGEPHQASWWDPEISQTDSDTFIFPKTPGGNGSDWIDGFVIGQDKILLYGYTPADIIYMDGYPEWGGQIAYHYNNDIQLSDGTSLEVDVTQGGSTLTLGVDILFA